MYFILQLSGFSKSQLEFFNSLCFSLQNTYKYLVPVSLYTKCSLSDCQCIAQNFERGNFDELASFKYVFNWKKIIGKASRQCMLAVELEKL